MKKFTTEDCIAFLNGTLPGNWKRKSKTGNEKTGIRRTFQSADGRVTVVLEKDGVLSIESVNNVVVIEASAKPAPAVPPPPAPVPAQAPTPTAATESVIPDKVVVNFVKTWASACFNSEPIVFDFQVAAAAITLRALLPPSFATTAMVKALRGTAKAKVGQDNPAFGIVAGMPRYTDRFLWALVKGVHEFLAQGDVMEREELITTAQAEERGERAPCFLEEVEDSQHKVNKAHCLAVAKAFEACAAKYGKAAPDPERKETCNVKPDEILEKLRKSGILSRATKEGEQLIKEFLAKNKKDGWEESWVSQLFRGKSFKDGTLTMTFFLGKAGSVHRPGGKYPWPQKAPVLTTRWSGEKLLKWGVEMQDVKTRY